MVWNIFYFSIYWEESSHLTNIFQGNWNHQSVYYNVVIVCWIAVPSWWYPLIAVVVAGIFWDHRCQWWVLIVRNFVSATQVGVGSMALKPRVFCFTSHERSVKASVARSWRFPGARWETCWSSWALWRWGLTVEVTRGTPKKYPLVHRIFHHPCWGLGPFMEPTV